MLSLGSLCQLTLCLLAALGCCCCRSSCCCFWVKVGTSWVYNLARFGDFVDQWNTGWNIQTCNILIRDIVQVLHQCAQGVTVRCNQNGLTALCTWQDFFLEVRDETLHDILQALCARNGVQVCVTGIFGLGVLSVIRKLWWSADVRTKLLHELLIAVLLLSLSLGHALLRSIVTLV